MIEAATVTVCAQELPFLISSSPQYSYALPSIPRLMEPTCKEPWYQTVRPATGCVARAAKDKARMMAMCFIGLSLYWVQLEGISPANRSARHADHDGVLKDVVPDCRLWSGSAG